MIAKRNFE